jgi:hypothetical protein
MMKSFKQGSAIAILALSLPFAVPAASAMPRAPSLATHSAGASDVTQVRWRSVPVIGGGGWHRGGGWHGGYRHHRHGWAGAGVGLGVASGLLLGSAIAAGSSPYYYGPGPGYYAAPAPVYDDSVTYCMNRFRSYDPASGTYLGYDGLRHPCP